MAATFPDVVTIEDSPRRVRVMLGGEVVADSRRMKLLHEHDHLPIYYFPLADVRTDLFEPSDKKSHCPRKGDARYWTVRVGEHVAENAVWNYPEPIDSCPDISDHAAFYWHKMDHWFEEDEEVFVHARDPYHRIDVVDSSRSVRVELDGVTLAESERPRLLFETGLPTRYYLPKLDVKLDLLDRTDTDTACPYKGLHASYWSARANGTVHRDLVWCYDDPMPEATKVRGMMAFFNERVDLWVDGELQDRPKNRWSTWHV
jgi:uncharacterized protein (DUF427 family)